MAFSNISNNEKLDIIDIAIVNNEEFNNNMVFKIAFEKLSDKKSNDRLFNTKYVSEEKAKDMLENSEIVGYLQLDNSEPKIVIQNNGIDETVFKYATEQVIQMSKTGVFENKEIKIKNITNKNMDYTMIEFYSLIAMAALYGGIFSIWIINQIMPNLSSKGKRISISPLKKGTIICSSLLASYIIQLLGILILFMYTIFVLKVDFGNRLGYIILLAIIGSLAGLSTGLSIGILSKNSENTKTGMLIGFTMLGCYFAGMMGISMKNIIDKNVPLINKINPAAMITDGFYSLYYYDNLNRYFMDVISLLIFSSILIIISFRNLRRTKYDSI